MRKVALIPAALAACGLLVLSAGAQETGKAAQAAASATPTIDQSLEWKAAFNPKISPDGMRVVYELQKTNWEENAFERNLRIADVATGESHALTSARKSSTNAGWSPDGKWIAFLSDRPGQITGTPDGKKQLYVISADGGEAQQLTKVEKRRQCVGVGAGFETDRIFDDRPGAEGAEGPQGKIRRLFGGSR